MKKANLFSLAPAPVWKQDWVVDCRPAGHGLSVLKYFAPYLYRVALSNHRLLSLANGQVCFQYRDGKSGQPQVATLSATVFLSRFLQHVPPDGFVKVRYYGFLHPKHRKLFETVLQALGAHPSSPIEGLQASGEAEPEGSPSSSLGRM